MYRQYLHEISHSYFLSSPHQNNVPSGSPSRRDHFQRFKSTPHSLNWEYSPTLYHEYSHTNTTKKSTPISLWDWTYHILPPLLYHSKNKKVKSLIPQPNSNPQRNINQAIFIQSRNWGFIWAPLNHPFTKMITKRHLQPQRKALFLLLLTISKYPSVLYTHKDLIHFAEPPFKTTLQFISIPYTLYSQHLSIQDHLKISLHKLALYAPNLQIYSPSNTRLLSPLAKFPNLHLQGPVTNSVKSIENFYCTTIQCEREHEEFHIMSLNTLVFLLISTTIMLVETNDGYY